MADGVLEQGVGFVGDDHAGTERQVSLLAVESIDKLFPALRHVNSAMVATRECV